MASYAYYELDTPIITDWCFDLLSKFLTERWTSLKHPHKHLITEDDLRAGSLTTRDFPEIVKGSTKRLLSWTPITTTALKKSSDTKVATRRTRKTGATGRQVRSAGE